MDSIDLNALAEEIWNEGLRNSFFGKFIGTTPDKPIQIVEDLNKKFGDFIVIPTEPEILSQNLTANEWVKKMNSAPKELWIWLDKKILKKEDFIISDFTQETLIDTVKNFFADSVSNEFDKIIHAELESNSTSKERMKTGDFSMILAFCDKPDLISELHDYKFRIGFQFYRTLGVKQLI